MKFIMVIECEHHGAKDLARVLREAPKDLGGLGNALVQMSAKASVGNRSEPGSHSTWWWAYEGS
jgi:hypothetical protein